MIQLAMAFQGDQLVASYFGDQLVKGQVASKIVLTEQTDITFYTINIRLEMAEIASKTVQLAMVFLGDQLVTSLLANLTTIICKHSVCVCLIVCVGVCPQHFSQVFPVGNTNSDTTDTKTHYTKHYTTHYTTHYMTNYTTHYMIGLSIDEAHMALNIFTTAPPIRLFSYQFQSAFANYLHFASSPKKHS